MSMRVVVDERERTSRIPLHLKALGVKVEYRMLALGDYVTTSGYAVERKEAHDFIGSLFSGRLFNQAIEFHVMNSNLLGEIRFSNI